MRVLLEPVWAVVTAVFLPLVLAVVTVVSLPVLMYALARQGRRGARHEAGGWQLVEEGCCEEGAHAGRGCAGHRGPGRGAHHEPLRGAGGSPRSGPPQAGSREWEAKERLRREVDWLFSVGLALTAAGVVLQTWAARSED
jgi:hypothetical protein